jgi:cyclopropane-fatty-acyl-phospholipid synthase
VLVRSRRVCDNFRVNYRRLVEKLFLQADIAIDGHRPFDIRVHDPRAYKSLVHHGSLGAGESYMAGWWDCDQLEEFVRRLFIAELGYDRPSLAIFWRALSSRVFNLQSLKRAHQVSLAHYDLDVDIFKAMLDQRMVYTCAYWDQTHSQAKTLEEAQVKKMDLVCKKLGLKPGMSLLDIGCGFGSLMKHAAENYGVSSVGYTLSKSQAEWAEKSCKGLPIEIRVQDYRKIEGQFDRVASVGMFEAVGAKNYHSFMKVVNRSMKEDALFLLHTVGHNVTTVRGDPWVDKYIFPNGVLPSISGIGKSIENIFVMEDWHNFGPDYALTLLEWNRRFQSAWPELRSKRSEKFKRMWEFYLLSFCGGFQARNWQLWQIVLSKPGNSRPHCRFS